MKPASKTVVILILSLGCTALLWAQSAGEVPTKEKNTTHLSYGEAVVLGLVEGVTEFLPISSTGHLILASHFLELDSQEPLHDHNGDSLWNTPPSPDYPEGNPFTVKSAVDAYTVVIQAGAIAAVALLYWPNIFSILLGVLGKSREGLMLGRNLLAAFLPAVVLGLLLEEIIDTWLFNYGTVTAALFLGGLLMLGVERWRKGKSRAVEAEAGPDLHELSLKQSLLIGLFQCVAMWPGMSRSMMTIVGGYVSGLSPRRAAEFSFLLGLPTLTGAALYKGLGAGPNMLEALGWSPVILGCIVAAVSAGLAVKWMVGYLTRHGLALFAWYRIALAGVLLILFLR